MLRQNGGKRLRSLVLKPRVPERLDRERAKGLSEVKLFNNLKKNLF